jgi:leucine dehydrogenase
VTTRVFDSLAEGEQVTFCHDEVTGLRAIIAIDSTALGPSLGGTRFRPYVDEAAALTDVCRLAQGMTLKHAAAGLDQGGGKAVIIGDPRTDRSDDLMRAYGRFIDGLAGRYLTAEDVGTTQADMDLLSTVTDHVTGTSESLGGSGDPSPATAHGVRFAMHAAAEARWGSPDLAGRHVCISGVGKVGSALARELAAVGAHLTVSDIDDDAVERIVDELGATAVATIEAHRVDCDIFAPCALGAVFDRSTIGELQCEVVTGAANNQLATDADDGRIAARDILYIPDFVANAGGVINIAEEIGGYDRRNAWQRVEAIADTVTAVLDRARADQSTTTQAAVARAMERVQAARLSSGAD